MDQPQVIRLLTDYICDEVAAARPAQPPAPDFPIIEGGLVDSLGLFKLIAFIDEKLGVKIAPEEIVLENFATIGAIAALVGARLPR